MFSCFGVELLESRTSVSTLFHPISSECSGLYLSEQTLHTPLSFIVDNNGTSRHVTVLCSVRDRVAHFRDSAFVDQVNNQLHFVKTLEVCHLGRVPGFNKRFESGFDK